MTKQDVEQYMDGNICRCTGYRPILDAFKTFGIDADQQTKDMVKDIEVWIPHGIEKFHTVE